MSDHILRSTQFCSTQKTQGRSHKNANGMAQQSWQIIALFSNMSGTWAETPGARMTLDVANALAQQGIIRMRTRNINARMVLEVQEVA